MDYKFYRRIYNFSGFDATEKFDGLNNKTDERFYSALSIKNA
jgi:hypothetical protein